ncbi:unnamed protein product [Strongylus vulgaris]|uniref:Uncharacterized protein n=1 Tax=Strongylus vulgaris TaxID=40348 RepID=A0A3P7JKC8_STRVU|nr:unnamed protein product [Strongylus vulgaris]
MTARSHWCQTIHLPVKTHRRKKKRKNADGFSIAAKALKI